MDKDKEIIVSSLRTTKEKYELINLIEEIEENVFKKDPKDYSTQSPFIIKMSKLIYSEINSKGLTNNRKSIESYLEKLIKITKEVPEMKLTLAIEPTQDLIMKIKDWTARNISREIVLDISVKKEILGGLILVSAEGKYINFSVQEQIDNYFTQKRQEIASLL